MMGCLIALSKALRGCCNRRSVCMLIVCLRVVKRWCYRNTVTRECKLDQWFPCWAPQASVVPVDVASSHILPSPNKISGVFENNMKVSVGVSSSEKGQEPNLYKLWFWGWYCVSGIFTNSVWTSLITLINIYKCRLSACSCAVQYCAQMRI